MDKEESEANAAEAEAALTQATDEARTAKKFLGAESHRCKQSEESYLAKQKVRKDEIKAIGDALVVINGMQMFQVKTSFLQLSTANDDEEALTVARNAKLAMLLRHRGSSLHSDALVQLADKITASPFTKVVKLIDEMLKSLQKEHAEAQTQHEFCKTERSNWHAKNDQNEIQLQKSAARLDRVKSEHAEALKRADEVDEQLAETDKSMTDMKAQRVDEKAAFVEVSRTAKKNQESLLKAKSILEGNVASTEAAGSDYGGKGSLGVVVTMLDSLLETEMLAFQEAQKAESLSEETHSNTMTDLRSMVAGLEVEQTALAGNIPKLAQEIQETTTSLNGYVSLQAEFGVEKKAIDGKCSQDRAETSQEKIDRITGEVQSLKEALEILRQGNF